MSIKKKLKTAKKWAFLGLILLVAVLVAIICIMVKQRKKSDDGPTIITTASLEQIIDVNELYTCQAYYNGIAEVYNEDKPDKIEFYVKYQSEIKAGIDVKEIEISLDEETKVIRIDVPDAEIAEPVIDESNLEYIFVKDRANDLDAYTRAMKAAEEDVEKEFDSTTLLKLADDNAKKVIQGLTEPFIKQTGADYVLVIE